MAKSKRTPLVSQFMENVSSVALEDYQDLFRSFAKRRHGVYALYKGKRLYYVGLAQNLRTRLKQHLRDRHGKAWDRFSMYLTLNDSHIKELESLVLRIVRPEGNRQKGKIVKARVLRNGVVSVGGARFNSPSLAALTACPGRRAINGWEFWTYERGPGDWVRLHELRR